MIPYQRKWEIWLQLSLTCILFHHLIPSSCNWSPISATTSPPLGHLPLSALTLCIASTSCNWTPSHPVWVTLWHAKQCLHKDMLLILIGFWHTCGTTPMNGCHSGCLASDRTGHATPLWEHSLHSVCAPYSQQQVTPSFWAFVV